MQPRATCPGNGPLQWTGPSKLIIKTTRNVYTSQSDLGNSSTKVSLRQLSWGSSCQSSKKGLGGKIYFACALRGFGPSRWENMCEQLSSHMVGLGAEEKKALVFLLFSLPLPFVPFRLSGHGAAPSIFKVGLSSPLILSGKTFFIDMLTDVPGNSTSSQVDNDGGQVHCLPTWHPDPLL